MKTLDFNHCARAFKKYGVDGAQLLELTRDDFKDMLTETGAIANGHHAYL